MGFNALNLFWNNGTDVYRNISSTINLSKNVLKLSDSQIDDLFRRAQSLIADLITKSLQLLSVEFMQCIIQTSLLEPCFQSRLIYTNHDPGP